MSDEMSKLDFIEKMILKVLRSQQSQRRWTIARFFLLVVFISGLAFFVIVRFNQLPQIRSRTFRKNTTATATTQKHIGCINIKGLISDIDKTSNQYVNSDNVIRSLNRAINNPAIVAVVLRINSRGGDPVTSNYIYHEILSQRKAHPTIPIIAVCEGICASAAYYIASACSEICASPVSTIGSIGVVSRGIGYPEILKKIGVESRSLTAGKNKNLLDPYEPMKPEHVHIMQDILSDLHAQIIEGIKIGRGNRLKLEQNEDELFSGRIWTGRQAMALGLIDRYHSLRTLSLEIFKVKKIVDYTYAVQPSFLQNLFNIASTSFVYQLKSQLLQPAIQF